MLWIWAAFVVFVLVALALDLGVFHRKGHVQSTRDALIWTVIWIGMGIGFAGVVYVGYQSHWMGMGLAPDKVDGAPNDGRTAAVKYLSGYLLEKSLSIDNLFVIAMVFQAFAIPAIKQHRILFWGVIGALLMRGALIVAGAELIARYAWVERALGAIVLITAVRMFLASISSKESHGDKENFALRLARRWFIISDSPSSRLPGSASRYRLHLSSAAIALISVEAADLVFALDSIPAIFAVTADPFLVFTSNVFAMLGLRSLYFVLSGMLQRFIYLNLALSIVLAIVGLKLLMSHWLHAWLGSAANLYLLGVVGFVLGIAIVASLLATRGPSSTPNPGPSA